MARGVNEQGRGAPGREPLEQAAEARAAAERDVLERVAGEARRHLAALDARPVRHAAAARAVARFDGRLPDVGAGDAAALDELIDGADETLVATGGPRFFDLVCGGAAPAALGADMLAAAWDPIASSAATSPLAVRLEELSIEWLRQLFDLPDGPGLLTTGAHAANLLGLSAARQWWGECHGVDVAEAGLAGLPALPVLATTRAHASIDKALAQLGLGRASLRRLEEGALADALAALGGAPAVVIGSAGTVDTGSFDDLERMADLAAAAGAWLHVDGAFGVFARATPRAAALAAGVERADSLAFDAHKWLEVPYDCGVLLLRDARGLARVNRLAATYLPRGARGEAVPGERRPRVFSNLDLGVSRRARCLAVWAVLRARGRAGVRAVVEAGLDRAAELAAAVDAAPDLERLADVPLNVVCFRVHPPGARRRDLDGLNEEVARAVNAEGLVAVGLTRHGGRVALRAAFVNSRTTAPDVALLVERVRAAAPSGPARGE